MNNTLLKKSNFEIDNSNLPIFNVLKIHCYKEQPVSEFQIQIHFYNEGAVVYTSDGSANIANNTDKKYTNKLVLTSRYITFYMKPGDYDLLITPKYQIEYILLLEDKVKLGLSMSDISYLTLSQFKFPSTALTGKLSELPKNTLTSCLLYFTQLTGDLSDIPQNDNLQDFRIQRVSTITGDISILSKYDKMVKAALQGSNVNGSLESLIAAWAKKQVESVKKRQVEVSSPVTINGNNVVGDRYSVNYFGNANVCMFNMFTNMLIGIYTISSDTWKYSWSASAHDTIQLVSDKDSPSWSITDGSSFASISSSGLLTCNAEGVVTISDGTNTFKVTIGA